MSEKYSISPISYAGIKMNHSELRVKSIMAYDNDTYTINIVNWNTIPIDRNTYNAIAKEIDNLSDEIKIKKRLQHTGEGKRVVNGRKIKEKYLFDVKDGGLYLNFKKYPEICALLNNNINVDETEERIWLNDNRYYINIAGCITGVIIPNDLTDEEEKLYIEVQRALKKRNINRIVNY